MLIQLKKNIRQYKKQMVRKPNFQAKESKEKAKFRQTSVWKKFRQKLKTQRKVDFITGKPLHKGFQIHHLDMSLANYKDLNPDNYLTVNRTSHELIHFLFRYKDWKEILKRIYIALERMEELNVRKSDCQTELEFD